MDSLTCDKARLLLSDMLTGPVAPPESAALDAHLGACPACRALAKDLVAQELLLFRKAAEEERAELATRMRSALAAAPNVRRRRILAWSAAAALLAVGTTASFMFVHSGPPAVAILEEVRGEVRPATAGEPLPAGAQIETTGRMSGATIRYPDGTTLSVSGDTLLTVHDADLAKRVAVQRGALSAKVVQQPANQPMRFETPQSVATVLGTTLQLVVVPGDKGSTRLEVTEGKVRLTRLADSKSIEVLSGHLAIVAPGAELTTRSATSLVGRWALDETSGTQAHDSSGNGGHAVVRGPGEWVSIPEGRGLRLGKSITVADFRHPLTAATLAIWIRGGNLPPGNDAHFKITGFIELYRHGANDPSQAYAFVATNRKTELVAQGVFLPDRWVHVAVVWDGRVARLYRDGLEVASALAEGPPNLHAGQQVQIGNEYSVDDPVYRDARTYSRALSATELRAVMRGDSVR